MFVQRFSNRAVCVSYPLGEAVAVRGLAAACPDVDVVGLLSGGRRRRRRLRLLLGACLWPLLLRLPGRRDLTEATQLLLLLLPSGSLAHVVAITLPRSIFATRQSKTSN